MRLPVGAVGVCGVIFGVVGFCVVCVGFGVGIVASTGKNKMISFNFCISKWN